MQASERQERATQAITWLCVVAVHAGLLWLLVQPLNRGQTDRGEQVRLRLVFLEPTRPLPPSTTASLPVAATTQAVLQRSVHRPTTLAPVDASTNEPTPGSSASAAELLEQGRQWAREQSPPGFEAMPLRSRRAQLPGGDRADVFRMRPPPSPKRVMGIIAKALGDPGPPPAHPGQHLRHACSDLGSGAELLEEVLRRDRESCRP